MHLSVLDLVPVRSDQTTGDALAATRSLARVAEEHGYHRYWLAEHHNMPAVAATNPPLLISLVAAATSRIRVGSGGVMLPNHAPLVVAEQFALLEAAFPGRIDLGIGRAPGSDPVTGWALRHGAGGVDEEAVARFPEYVDNVISMMSPGGVGLQVGGRLHALTATPAATSVPPVWLLGSSDYSARLAASRGLPYVFAHHFSGKGTAEALELYRSTFQPSEATPEPRTFLTVNAVVAQSQDDADRLALPQLQAMVALRTGQPLAPQRLVEEAEKETVPAEHQGLLEAMARRWVIGTPASAAAEVRELASSYDVDEVMVHPVAGAFIGSPVDASPARETTLRPARRRPRPETSRVVRMPDRTVRQARDAAVRIRTIRICGRTGAARPPRTARTCPGRSTHFWPCQSMTRRSISRTWAWNSSAGEGAGLERGQPQHPGTDRLGQPLQGRHGQGALLPDRVQRHGRHLVEVGGVGADLVGRARQGRGHARSELALEHGHHVMAHPRAGEARVAVLRVGPELDALRRARRLGLRPGQVEQRPEEQVLDRPAHPRQ